MKLFLVLGKYVENGGDIPFGEYVFSDDVISAIHTVVDFVTKGDRKIVKECSARLIVPVAGLILD